MPMPVILRHGETAPDNRGVRIGQTATLLRLARAGRLG